MPHNLTPRHVPSDDEMNEAIELVRRVGPIEALSVAREQYGLTNKPGLNTAICLVAAESIKIGGTIIPPVEKKR